MLWTDRLKMNENEAQRVTRCRAYYESKFQHVINEQIPEPIDAVLHVYLNGFPTASALSQQNRAAGLATANFWQNLSDKTDSSLLRFALSQLLRFDQAIPLSFIDLVIIRNPDLMRWAIRYSRLFENPDSIVYKHLRAKYATEEWLEFFAVCDRLLIQLDPYKAAILTLEKKLKFMTVTDFFCYLSILAWQKYFDSMLAGKSADFSKVYDRLLQMKLVTTKSETMQVTSESKFAQSIKQHLMPLLIPESYPLHTYLQCVKNLQLVVELFWNTQELIDYEVWTKCGLAAC